MIVIRNYEEACSLWQQSEIPFRLLQEMAFVLAGIVGRDISNAVHVTQTDIEGLLIQPEAQENFMGMLGGNIHVCQTEADLSEIVSMDMCWADCHNGNWPNCMDQAMSWDQCCYLNEKSVNPQWVVFLNCTNDAGGNTFYVPRALFAVARVSQHVAETERYWNCATEV